MLQVKAHFFKKGDPISIICFLVTFEVACNSNETHEGAAMWIFQYYVHENFEKALNSHMYAESWLAPLTASVQIEWHRSGRTLRPCPETVKYPLRKYVSDQAVPEHDASILQYVRQASITPQQCADVLTSKMCKVADVYDEGVLNDLFTELVEQSIRYSFRTCLTTNR